MSDFSARRDALATALRQAGIPAFATKPDKFSPPAAFVGPGDPYITREGANFGGEVLHHEVVVVTRSGVNDKRADDLDQLITKALDALYALDDFDTGEVGRPGQINVSGQSHLAAAISVSCQIHRS